MPRISTIYIWISPSHDYELNGTCNICFSIKTSTLSLFAATANLHFFFLPTKDAFRWRQSSVKGQTVSFPEKQKLIPWGQNNFKLLATWKRRQQRWWLEKSLHFSGKLPPRQRNHKGNAYRVEAVFFLISTICEPFVQVYAYFVQLLPIAASPERQNSLATHEGIRQSAAHCGNTIN